MNDYMDERAAHEVVIRAPEGPRCAFVSIDTRASTKFADFLLDSEFEEPHVAMLYGSWVEDPKEGTIGVKVDVVYDPPQEYVAKRGFKGLLSGGAEAKRERAMAAAIASRLGLVWVGWAYSHRPRVHAFEVDEIGEMCTQAAAAAQLDERAKRGFVSVRFRPVYEDEDLEGEVTAEVYQPTEQCVEIIARNILQRSLQSPDQLELKPELDLEFKYGTELSTTMDAFFFLARVHDLSRPFTSPLRAFFPAPNRDAVVRKLHLKRFLEKARAQSTPFLELARDFAFLLHISTLIPEALLLQVCDAVALKRAPGKAAKAALLEAEKLLCDHVKLAPP